MFQSFEVTSTPEKGPKRLAQLRGEIAREGLDGFLVPRADRFQGEYVTPCDARLAWLTGFTGSAGFCAALMDRAGVFVDGRYRTQVKSQVDLAYFTPVDWPETTLADWLKQALPDGGRVGFDPWLHTKGEMEKLADCGVELVAMDNLVDRIWADRPARPSGKIMDYPVEFAGETSGAKRKRIAADIKDGGSEAAVLTLPDSICWLLNIRGSDIERNPVVQGFAILHADGQIDLFTDPAKAEGLALVVQPWEAFEPALKALQGIVRVDPDTAPVAVSDILQGAGIEVQHKTDPCILPKACKNTTEIAGTRAAHLRDGVAMANFLAWLDDAASKGGLTEIEVVKKLEGFRRDTNALRDISFETICGAGPNGAIIHYRVTEETNREIRKGELLLVDSGGQYLDGTTDITRTIAVGDVADEEKACFTRVLQGMIAISRARFPKGLAGRDLDALARFPLWLAGQDYNHGTGHGVGTYLSVHEGPQRISRASDVPLQAGMILSNEPGYYREGAFGIRIENLIVVQPAPALQGADDRDMMAFETLTYVPIDKRLTKPDMLSSGERDWLNAYHAQTHKMLSPLVTEETLDWLTRACAPL
ncbi:aminopeptidase P family protein [Profundibacter sp.]|uniref:aminopeptidase P family protein n=1 Tax=Profundibacter sp. TaxID=3101071 RepID=UPI003D108B56